MEGFLRYVRRAVLLAAALLPAVAHAATLEIPRALRGGQTVTLNWNSHHDVDELELLLRFEDGSRFESRLTPQLAGQTSRITWTVPNIPASHAVLEIRAGNAFQEQILVSSAQFAITEDLDLPRAEIVKADGEWWIDRTPRHGHARGMSEGAVSRSNDSLPSFTNTSRDEDPAWLAAATRQIATMTQPSSAPAPTLPDLSRSPRVVPQRK